MLIAVEARASHCRDTLGLPGVIDQSRFAQSRRGMVTALPGSSAVQTMVADTPTPTVGGEADRADQSAASPRSSSGNSPYTHCCLERRVDQVIPGAVRSLGIGHA